MGGSGEFSPRSVNFSELFDRLRQSQDETKRAEFESQVANEIAQLLSGFERDANAVKKHLDEIKRALSSDIDGTVDFMFGGSIAKHTFVDGLSDVDGLVILNKSELVKKQPKDALGYFLNRLRGRFPKSDIEKGNLAVTVRFDDIDVQLLPAIKTKTGVNIADPSTKGWQFIRPAEFQRLLTKTNDKTGGKLVPTIKLAKAVIDCFPENRRLIGYHTEALAVKIFQDYKGEAKPKDMLKHFFKEASKRVLNPIPDVTGQSGHLDSYLGKRGAVKRKMVGDSLGSIGRRMENADIACSAEQWREILGGL